MRNPRRGLAVAGIVLMLALAGPAPTLRAQEVDAPVEESVDGSATRKLLDYAACAIGIATIGSGLSVALVVVGCARALETWFSE